MFVRRCKIFRHVLCDDDHKSVQSGLNALQEWSDKWLLKLNAGKFRTVFYAYNYLVHSAELNNLTSIKDLIDFSFIQNCREKIMKLMQFWGLLRETLCTYQRKLLFHYRRL